MSEEMYNLDEMLEDEKDELILDLIARYNSAYSSGAGMFNAMQTLAARLQDGTSLFRRKHLMQDTAARMGLISRLCLPGLGVDLEQLAADAEFDRITADLEELDE